VIALLALLSLATAQPLEGTTYECPEAFALVPGRAVPQGLVIEGIVQCSAVAVPTTWVAKHELAMVELARVTELRRLDALDLAWYQRRVEALERPPPLLDRPAVREITGGAKVAAAVVLGVLVVRAAEQR